VAGLERRDRLRVTLVFTVFEAGMPIAGMLIGRAAGLSILLTVIWIGVQAFVATQVGLRLGARVGEEFRERAEWVAGVALIGVALVLLVLKLTKL
jgi:putative Mn2+ efflux pump MntP